MANDIAVPHNFEAEQSLLGALFMNNELSDRIRDFLEPRHFYDPVHGRIYGDILKLVDSAHPASPVTLRPYFENDPDIAVKGGVEYLARLAGSATSLINAESYARTIHALAQRRSLLKIGQEIFTRAQTVQLEDPPEKQIEEAEMALYEAAERGRYGDGFQKLERSLESALEIAESALNSDRHISGLSTGFIDLDESLGGLQKSDLIIIAGRTSMGKTALALNIAANAASAWKGKRGASGNMETEAGAIVGFFSLEMAAEQLGMRLLSQRARTPSSNIRQGRIGQDEFRRLSEACQEMRPMPLYIDETGAIPLTTLLARARRMKRRGGLDLLVVDYLQLVMAGRRRYGDGRVQEVAEITQGLKAIAKELNIPVIALSQLSRAVEAREDKRPQLSDLRESGAIEQDADVVLFVHREEYYLGLKEPRGDASAIEHDEWKAKMDKVTGVAEIIIGKHRHGATGKFRMYYDARTTHFSDLERSGRASARQGEPIDEGGGAPPYSIGDEGEMGDGGASGERDY